MLKNIKLLLTGLVIGTLLTAGTAALADRPVKLFLDGNEIPNADAMIIEGRTYVPLRVISEALGVEVGWDESQWAVKLKRTTETGRPSDLPPTNNNGNSQGQLHQSVQTNQQEIQTEPTSSTQQQEKQSSLKSYYQDDIHFVEINNIKYGMMIHLAKAYPNNKLNDIKVTYDNNNFIQYQGFTYINYKYFVNNLIN